MLVLPEPGTPHMKACFLKDDTAAAPFAILHPRFEHSADFIAGILCVPLVHDIQERGKVIVCGIGTVNIVVDSDEPNTL